MDDISLYTVDGLRITHDGSAATSEHVQKVNATLTTDRGQQLVALYNLFLLMHNVNSVNDDISLQWTTNIKKTSRHEEDVGDKFADQQYFGKADTNILQQRPQIYNQHQQLLPQTLKSFPYKAFFLPAQQTSQTLYVNNQTRANANQNEQSLLDKSSFSQTKKQAHNDDVSAQFNVHCANENRSANGWQQIIVRQSFVRVNGTKSDQLQNSQQIYVPAELKVETSVKQWLCVPVKLTAQPSSVTSMDLSDGQPIVFCCTRKQVQ